MFNKDRLDNMSSAERRNWVPSTKAAIQSRCIIPLPTPPDSIDWVVNDEEESDENEEVD